MIMVFIGRPARYRHKQTCFKCGLCTMTVKFSLFKAFCNPCTLPTCGAVSKTVWVPGSCSIKQMLLMSALLKHQIYCGLSQSSNSIILALTDSELSLVRLSSRQWNHQHCCLKVRLDHCQLFKLMFFPVFNCSLASSLISDFCWIEVRCQILFFVSEHETFTEIFNLDILSESLSEEAAAELHQRNSGGQSRRRY